MQVTINGEARTVPPGTTITGLLSILGVTAPMVAVELNRAIVRRAQHALVFVNDGDRLEIVTFVGGG